MQRPVLAAATLKLPFCALAVIFQFCDAPPLQALSTMPMPLVPAPASRHFAGVFTGEIVQFDPLGAIVKTEVREVCRLVALLDRRGPGVDDHRVAGVERGRSVYW